MKGSDDMDDLDKPVSVRLPKELNRKLKQVAKRNGTTLGGIIRMTLMDVYPVKETA